MALEIERKFLVAGEYKSFATSSERITQGYLSSASGRTVRVRIRGEKGYLTVKGPSKDGGLSRFEWEMEIPMPDARALLDLCEPGVIDKTRWLIPAGDGIHTWEVDEFHGTNDGLVVAEIELRSESDSFELPSWLGPEVTGDRRYYNSQLTQHPFSSWDKR
ncbi:MAG: CYTH domain-containing protein [Bacteroidales bacterium]|nr:CYTH domain-containing protein [Bacteroidales bacterium]